MVEGHADAQHYWVSAPRWTCLVVVDARGIITAQSAPYMTWARGEAFWPWLGRLTRRTRGLRVAHLTEEGEVRGLTQADMLAGDVPGDVRHVSGGEHASLPGARAPAAATLDRRARAQSDYRTTPPVRRTDATRDAERRRRSAS